MFEDVRHERSIVLILSLTNPVILKQSKCTDHETIILKNLAPEKIHRQSIQKEYVTVSLIDYYFLFTK